MTAGALATDLPGDILIKRRGKRAISAMAIAIIAPRITAIVMGAGTTVTVTNGDVNAAATAAEEASH